LNSNENNRRNLQSPTMMRLQSSNMSINNINPNDSEETSENEHQSHSRSTTPKPFNCRVSVSIKFLINIFKTSQYRSLNLKRNKERQEEILKQLANLRMQLKDKQTQMERTWSNQSLARSATTGSMLNTLNKG
jgi:succinate dehydrogenase/fumarate reductase flavoprotein subunit